MSNITPAMGYALRKIRDCDGRARWDGKRTCAVDMLTGTKIPLNRRTVDALRRRNMIDLVPDGRVIVLPDGHDAMEEQQ